MNTYSWIFCAIAVAGCVPSGGETSMAVSAPAPERHGPQIVPRETVDWTPLNSIVEIKLTNLRRTVIERRGSEPAKVKEDSEPDSVLRQIILKVFPTQKFVTLTLSPDYSLSSGGCREQGQFYGLMFVASPGASVSDQITCTAQGIFDRWRTTANYQTTSKFAANTLTIDGSGRIQVDAVNTYKGGSSDMNSRSNSTVELHGAIQITGTTCRVVAWRHTVTGGERVAYGGQSDQTTTLEAGPDTTCAVIRASN